MPTYPPKQERKEIDLIPAGTHLATCYQLLCIGTIPYEYQGEQKEKYVIRLGFELPNEMMVFKEENGPQPRVISAEYTLSLGDRANLRPIVEGMLGRKLTDEEKNGAFDVESLVGTSCLIAVVHEEWKEREYAKIASTSPLMKGMEVPPQINPTRIFTYQNWDKEYFEKLPKFIKDKIMSSREYEHMIVNKQETAAEMLENSPF